MYMSVYEVDLYMYLQYAAYTSVLRADCLCEIIIGSSTFAPKILTVPS